MQALHLPFFLLFTSIFFFFLCFWGVIFFFSFFFFCLVKVVKKKGSKRGVFFFFFFFFFADHVVTFKGDYIYFYIVFHQTNWACFQYSLVIFFRLFVKKFYFFVSVEQCHTFFAELIFTYWAPMYSALILSLIHISEPTRPLYISYAVFCLKKKKYTNNRWDIHIHKMIL
eukprot:TRINITY_DN60879_c0_g1_i1.p2 TRINITY_DN60879_c0_g1~~TRINITY_DN60879_c0_g1_i1.p2  ORF type:complete len:170 (+),score=46.17 TRINITY_DN60879_c0_g1_i1:43-552(+)